MAEPLIGDGSEGSARRRRAAKHEPIRLLSASALDSRPQSSPAPEADAAVVSLTDFQQSTGQTLYARRRELQAA